jgi:hypothetical protein
VAFGQSAPANAAPDAGADSQAKSSEIKPDLTDPGVSRAQQNLERIRSLVQQGILPPLNQIRAQEDLNDALDMSILRTTTATQDLSPDQADQLVIVAQRMYLRRQRRAIQTAQLVSNGVLSRSEVESANLDVMNAKIQLDLATERASIVKDFAIQKQLAQAETDAEAHPEWNGKLYSHYDGNGVFTRADFDRISVAFMAEFGRAIPVSADGQTEVHKALGFNHAGRIDVAINPDQREGIWLLHYLEQHHIPYYAFRTAIAHKATGAHIHLGPGSTRLSASTKTCCAGS